MSAPFLKYDLVEVLVRDRRGERVEHYQVTSDLERYTSTSGEIRTGWSFTYRSAEPERTHWYGWGQMFLRDQPTPFGWVSWKVVGHKEPPPSPRPPCLVGDPAYDLG